MRREVGVLVLGWTAIGWGAAPEPAPSEVPPPGVSVAARRGAAALSVAPPEGRKLGAEAPFRLVLDDGSRAAAFDGPGADLAAGLPLGRLGGEVTGTLDVALCDLAGTTCQPTTWALAGAVPTRGAADLRVAAVAQARDGAAPRFGAGADTAEVDAALARAGASGKPVLIDFSAAWCPPCNQLAAEVLDVGDPALAGFEVAVVDADHPSSFPLKDRYDVGGYPTVLVVDAAGAERTRIVGYPGRDAFRTWLGGAGASTEAAELAAGPGSASPERAAEVAWALVQRGDEPGDWLARADGVDTADAHLARLAAREDPAELAWVLDHAPARALDAVPLAVGLAEGSPELVRRLADAAAPLARGTQQADVLELRAATFPEGSAERSALTRGAAAAVAATLTGEPAHDKPHLTWLAQLHEAAGEPERAVALLREASAQWPGEPTYDLALAALLGRLGRPEEGLAAARVAVARSWGDNRLRAAAAEARALAALGRAEESRAVATAALAAQPAPPPGTNPRTERYRRALADLAGAP